MNIKISLTLSIDMIQYQHGDVFDKVLYENEVRDILQKVKTILNDKCFNANKNLIVIFKPKNKVFMQEKSFGRDDIVDVLGKLEVNNYIKSVLDNKDISGLYLHEFAIEYNNVKYVYIKFKLTNNDIFIKVVSFHKNEYNFTFAYNEN